MARVLEENDFRDDKMPHIWCPGCGHGIVMQAVARAIDRTGWDKDRISVVSGIGCSGRASGYMNFDTLHTTHGRALGFATGIKMSKPEMKVIVITGDGDAGAIGGNHLIHACRRNIDITTVCFNNNIYGMTGGQYSPTTPTGDFATTAPYGNIDQAFDLAGLARAAGAAYVARGTAYHITQLTNYLEKGLVKEGFSFIDAASPCPTYYGRRNKMASPVQNMEWLKEAAVPLSKAEEMGEDELEDKLVVGEFCDRDEPEYTARYEEVVKRAREGGGS